MRRARALPLVLLLLGGALAGRAGAQTLADVTRPCTAADLIGAWQVIRFGVTSRERMDPNDPAFFPFQRYVFAKDATLRYLSSKTPIRKTNQPALLATAQPGTWAVEGGRLLLLRQGQAALDRSLCLVLVKEVVDPKNGVRSLPGDVLLTRVDAGEQPLDRSQLRKIEMLGE